MASIRLDLRWEDLGTWEDWFQHMGEGEGVRRKSDRVFISSANLEVHAYGVSDLAIVESAGRLLVMPLSEARNLKNYLEDWRLIISLDTLRSMDWTEQRPWGRFKNLLDADYTKVKLIEVDPGKRLSYQSHTQRRESWTVVKGQARITLDDRILNLKVGDQIDIPKGSKHRLENPGSEILAVIEAQTGSYFGEDDIKRYEDDWGRG